MKKIMCFSACFLWQVLGSMTSGFAQSGKQEIKALDHVGETSAFGPVPMEVSSVTDHSVKIGGVTINYTATAGTILLKNSNDEPTASIFYMAYTKNDVKALNQRPLAFCYNGGPGSSSLWMHMGAFGPRRVVFENGQSLPPYKIVDNGYSILDESDLVFIDPVGTGFSHAVGKVKDKDFWGVDEDALSFAQFISSYVSRNGRWNSPKYLIGESYGTFRSAALVNYLQSHEGMQFNGLVLISSVLDLSQIVFPPGHDLSYILYIPSYAATAWYHNMLGNEHRNLEKLVAEARQFAAGEYAASLFRGSGLDVREKSAIAEKLSRFTGLTPEYWVKSNLRVNLAQFRAELQRERGLTTGRLDARFSGPLLDLLSEFADYDPASTEVWGAFAAAFNDYVRDELKFGKEMNYVKNSEQAGESWNWRRAGAGGLLGSLGLLNAESDLIQAMKINPRLHIQVENGYYDLATPFFATEYTMDHLGLGDTLRKNIELKYYEAGHSMYIKESSLVQLKTNINQFIQGSGHR